MNPPERLEEYESLLIEKETLEKECFRYYEEYMLAFGDLLVTIFETKVDVVTLKKKIAFCVQRRNRGQIIRRKDLESYVDSQLASYRLELRNLQADRDEIKSMERAKISHDAFAKLRRLYFKIAHLIHPDLHPELADNEDIQSLWVRATEAFHHNNGKVIREVYDRLVLLGVVEHDSDIEDLEARIAAVQQENEEMRNSPEYQYRFILVDEESKQEHQTDLKRQLDEFTRYRDELVKELSKFTIVTEVDA